MKKLLGILKAGAALGALAAAIPAMADTETVPPNTTTTIPTPIIDGSSATSLTVTGGGTLILTNPANSYSGGTTVDSNSILGIDTDSELGNSNGALTLGGGTASGTLQMSPSSALTSSRSIVLGGSDGILSNNSNANPWTFSGVVTGGNLIVTGGGTVQFTNTSNNYSGNTTIIGNGTLQVGADSELGNPFGTLTLGNSTSSGTLDLTPTQAVNGAVISGRPITLNGEGGIIVASPTVWTFDGQISGAGSLTVTAPSATPGTIALNALNTYTGGTSVTDGGILAVDQDSNLGATGGTPGAVTLSGGGTLAFTDGTVTTKRALILGAGGGALDAEVGSWTFTTPVTGSGSLTIGTSATGTGITGTIILNAINTYTGGTTVAGGTLEIGDASTAGASASVQGDVAVSSGGTLTGRGSVAGTITNDGTVNPGVNGAGTMNVTNFVQNSDGTLEISMTPSAVSQLIVAGNANLSGSVAINPVGLLHGGTYQLVTAGSITDNLNPLDRLSIGFAQSLAPNPAGTGLELTLTQLKSLPENPSIYPALANAALDDAQRSTDTILKRMSDSRSNGSLDQMVIATTDEHLTDDCSGCTPFGLWFQPFGNVGSTDSGAAAPGYNSHDFGFLTGFDMPVGDDGDDAKYVVGVAVGYSRSTVSESGGASGNVSTPRVEIYGSWWTGPYAVDATLGVGYANFSGTRPITVQASSTSANYGGVQIASSVQGSRVFNVKSFVLTPAVGVEFARQAQHGFQENGGSYYDLVGLSSSSTSLRPFVSATLAKRFDLGLVTRIEPQIRVAYAVETLNSPDISVDPTADAYTFHYTGVTPSRGRASFDAGITLEATHALNVFTNAGVVEAGNSHGEQFDAGVRCRF